MEKYLTPQNLRKGKQVYKQTCDLVTPVGMRKKREVPPHVYTLLHSPNVEVIELSMGYKTWPSIGCHYPFLLVGLNIDWDCLMRYGSLDQWEFPPFSVPNGSTFSTALAAVIA